MEEERLMILKMVEDGKITSEEAAELLAALETHARTERELEDAELKSDFGQHMEALEERVEKTAGGIEKTATDFAERLERQITEKVEHVPSMIERIMEGINLPGFIDLLGPGHEFVEELTGEFAAEAGSNIELDFQTRNGRIEVLGWDEAGYKLVLTKKVQAGSREEAEEVANKLVDVEQGADCLRIHWTKPSGTVRGGVHIKAYLPVGYLYQSELTSANGRIIVEGLNLDSAELSTSNGRIVCTRVRAGDIQARTSNGRVVLEGVSGNVRARTSNGRIKLITSEIEENVDFDLETSNGSVKVITEERDDLGYYVDAYTSLGKIYTTLPNLVFEEDNRERRGHKSVKARTVDFDTRPVQVRIAVRTSNGSLRIGWEGE